MRYKSEPAIWSQYTRQWMPCFDRCQLTITQMLKKTHAGINCSMATTLSDVVAAIHAASHIDHEKRVASALGQSNPMKGRKIHRMLMMQIYSILTLPRRIGISTKYVLANFDDCHSGSLSITVAVECGRSPAVCLSMPTSLKVTTGCTRESWV